VLNKYFWTAQKTENEVGVGRYSNLDSDENCAEETTWGNNARLELVDIVNDRKQGVRGLVRWSASYRASGEFF
jgi:hypothetical protein